MFFALVLSAAPSAQSQGAANLSATQLAQRIEQHYQRVATLRAAFLERYSEGAHDARVESGTVYFRRPGQMRWEYESPEQKLFIADGKTVWFYVPADQSVTRQPMKESSDWRTPLALLTGRAKLSRLCDRIDIVDAKANAEGHVVLRCTPRGEQQPKHTQANSSEKGSGELPPAGDFTDVLLEVSPESGELFDVRVRQPGGIEIEYRFGDWRENLPLQESLFHFQAPPGVAIVNGAAPGGSFL